MSYSLVDMKSKVFCLFWTFFCVKAAKRSLFLGVQTPGHTNGCMTFINFEQVISNTNRFLFYLLFDLFVILSQRLIFMLFKDKNKSCDMYCMSSSFSIHRDRFTIFIHKLLSIKMDFPNIMDWKWIFLVLLYFSFFHFNNALGDCVYRRYIIDSWLWPNRFSRRRFTYAV